MYIVLYNFLVKPKKVKQFVESWKGLTNLIYEFEGSLGSRLHKKDDLNYIAYAQWRDKSTFDNSGKNLPEKANGFRDVMRASCKSVDVLYKLDVVEDLLKENSHE